MKRDKLRSVLLALMMALIAISFISCEDGSSNMVPPEEDNTPEWTTETHYYAGLGDPDETGGRRWISADTSGGKLLCNLSPSLSGAATLYFFADASSYNVSEENYNADKVLRVNTRKADPQYDTIENSTNMTYDKYVTIDFYSFILDRSYEKTTDSNGKTTYKTLTYDELTVGDKQYLGKAVIRDAKDIYGKTGVFCFSVAVSSESINNDKNNGLIAANNWRLCSTINAPATL